jgi:hypothetical protein
MIVVAYETREVMLDFASDGIAFALEKFRGHRPKRVKIHVRIVVSYDLNLNL